VIPLRALLLRRRPATVTALLIGINLFCFLFEIAQPPYLERAFVDRYALVPDHFRASALLTSMFLHGGWMHLIGNMWFLWVFGSHVEEALGSAKFTLFYLLGGIASAFVQFILNLGSPIPTLGASGAIACVMGGFLLLYPRARIVTLVFIIVFITTVELPAAFMLVYWFAIQLLSGIGSLSTFTDQGGVAWFAHVGGFLAGLLLIRLFAGSRPARTRYSY
jgi:membrane associated rhomboid family serine protease